MQREMRDSGACLKAQCIQNLSSPIQQLIFDTVIIKASIYSILFTLNSGRNRSSATDSVK